MHLLHGSNSLSSPAIRASLPDGQRLDGFRHIMHAQNGGTPRRTRERIKSWQAGPSGQIFDHVYAESHPLMDEQRDEVTAYLDSFVEEVH